MTLPSLCTRSQHASLRSFFAGLMVAAILGVGASPVLFAQQLPRGVTQRRPEASNGSSVPGQRVAAANAGEKRPASAPGAKAPRSRAPAADHAASGVQQASSTAAVGDGVVLAGGAMASGDCRQCGRRGCGKCRPAGDRVGLPCNGLCEQGGCPAHCPVRPDQFGYYATRWRSWPGRGVKQVGHFDPATTPVVPPRSEVPGMEEELALPSLRDQTPAEEDEDEEEEDKAEGEQPAQGPGDTAQPADGVGTSDKGDRVEGDGPTANAAGATGGEDIDAKSGEKAKPSKAPLDGLLDTSGADATRQVSPVTDGAWSNWSRGTTAERQPTAAGSVVRTSGPVEATEGAASPGDRREGAKLRSPAQRMVEGSDRAVGRWRAKATASGDSSAESAANPLRGVTAQPGNPLR